MKTVLRALAIAALLTASQISTLRAAVASDPLIARAHFVGSEQLFADPSGSKQKELWTLPSSVAFRNAAVDRFTPLLAQYFRVKSTADNNKLIRPLLEDLLAQESFVEFRATPEMAIAVKLPDSRMKIWDANLRQAVGGWNFAKPSAVNSEGFVGWEMKRSQSPQTLRFGRINGWTILAAGPEKMPLAAQVIANIRAQRTPAKQTGAWLAGDLNLTRVKGWLPLFAGLENVPMAHFSFSNRADFVRMLVTLDFPKPHNWKAEPWHVPTNSIFDPLSSFIAARGIAPLLESIPAVRQIGWSPTPNQITGWGIRELPFQFIYATPTRDITNQLKRVAPALKSVVAKANPNLVGSFVQDTNTAEIIWQGLPMTVPRLSALPRNPDFLAFEMFPQAATKKPAPPELFQQLSPKNLALYEWEITQDRIPSWIQFYQITEIATRRRLGPTNSPGAQWVSGLVPKLGETVTELNVVSPTQMNLIRKSHLGLNAFELVTLSRWIESTNFPAFGTALPQPVRARASEPARRKSN